MRNHKLVHSVVDKLLLYNHSLYIEDINNLMQSRKFNSNINNYLYQICNILHIILQKQNHYDVEHKIVQSLKTWIYLILDNDGGIECCNTLQCAEN